MASGPSAGHTTCTRSKPHASFCQRSDCLLTLCYPMCYPIYEVPATWDGFDAEPTQNRRWSRRRRAHCPGFGPLHTFPDAVWTPERWRRSAMEGWRSLLGCLIARRLVGDKREGKYPQHLSTIRLWPDFRFFHSDHCLLTRGTTFGCLSDSLSGSILCDGHIWRHFHTPP